MVFVGGLCTREKMRPKFKFRFDFTQPAFKVIKPCPVLSCAPETSAYAAGAEMSAAGRHSCVVTSPKTGRLAGILSERDFLTKLPLERGAAQRTSVAELMTPVYDVSLGSAACTMEQVVKRMRTCKISSLPLVDREADDEVRAVINMKDIAEQVFLELNERRDPDSFSHDFRAAARDCFALIDADGSGALDKVRFARTTGQVARPMTRSFL